VEFLAFASFAALVVAWLVAPSRGGVVVLSQTEEREAA
jgi:hypothetical protein